MKREIYPSLYQFGITIPNMGFTIHQYVLNGESPVLFATGTVQQAEMFLPQIKQLLNGKEVSYIVVSHIESDECGGLPVFLQEYPNAKILCSEIGARELPGYGIKAEIIACNSETTVKDDHVEFQFIDYPAEFHLQNGILAFEKKSGILYSADLFLRFGEGADQCMDLEWEKEVASLTEQSVANKEKLVKLKEDLMEINPSFVAVGHGYCLKVR
ncbi:MAG: MBL fold metallo-hydrolase [bacterium]|nr:MBL fold metallo-hydrolase [bacterium]